MTTLWATLSTFMLAAGWKPSKVNTQVVEPSKVNKGGQLREQRLCWLSRARAHTCAAEQELQGAPSEAWHVQQPSQRRQVTGQIWGETDTKNIAPDSL